MKNIDKLRAYLEKNNLDAYFIQKLPNIRYISGFEGEDSAILITLKNQYILTDPRYTEQAAIEVPDYTIIDWRASGHGLAVQSVVEKEGLKSLAFEDDQVVYAEYADFSQAINAELVPAAGVIEEFRQIKTAQEIQYLQNACEISCRALNRLFKDIKVGVTEKELAAKLALYMVQEGADTKPYGNILISGTKTSLLHGIPSSKPIEYGDLLLMDFGCQFNGYLSDMTRTVVVGKATAKQREVYELEKRMLEDAEAAMKAGVAGGDVYKASLKAVAGTEYEKYTYSNVGHGIGMFVHEFPQLTTRYDGNLEEGNVITVEPGIYIPGWGGIRIEDQVLVTKDGIENMISIPHDLIEL
ncbi:xaa-Pro aminopeptidase [Enterococcus sp. AZ194]|uniref:M24 family metallopeptidase n=1 Tax=Enterococcus sp. AZ194 TaxID=2774629 RepID=UPI003F22A221